MHDFDQDSNAHSAERDVIRNIQEQKVLDPVINDGVKSGDKV